MVALFHQNFIFYDLLEKQLKQALSNSFKLLSLKMQKFHDQT